MLYRRKFSGAVSGRLMFENLNDYGHFFINGVAAGQLDRRKDQKSIELNLPANSTLDVVVENMGRINFGEKFIFDRKGIFGKVMLGSDEIRGWEMFRLPLDDLRKLKFARRGSGQQSFFRGSFSLDRVTGGTFFDMRGWGKGHVWVNGVHLGRYWKIGPQQSMFCAAEFLRPGRNEIIVLDLENDGRREISGGKDAVYGN
jgi:beta-galactosidase